MACSLPSSLTGTGRLCSQPPALLTLLFSIDRQMDVDPDQLFRGQAHSKVWLFGGHDPSSSGAALWGRL